MEYYLATKRNEGVSLVAEGWRIRLPMQETWVWSLICEDSTCCGATKPVRHNHWACAPELGAATTEPTCYSQCSATREATEMRSPRTMSREKLKQQQRPSTAKSELKKKKKDRNQVLAHTINLENIMLSERNQYKEPYTGWFHLAEMSGKGKPIVTVH